MSTDASTILVADKSDAECRLLAVGLAADMEMGYYVDPDGYQWEPRPFVIAQVLRHLGYGESRIREGKHPAWWPPTDDFRRMVALKVLLRRTQTQSGTSGFPALDAALAASTEELLERLMVRRDSFKSSDLVDLTTKLARLSEERRRSGHGGGAAFTPETIDAKGVPKAFRSIDETIAALPPEEQDRARTELARYAERARKVALPDSVAS